ncbi:MAG: hypothetical protein Terrestrivirus13_17 [Terrestrivirus sp.]|uniref:Uncharacterized protein n=1 Tax=Terrestrivirus sp. TaxID=2487775 RepID=A0A3G4ZRX8_9VIRU|nr:MAG: hypothetical protein Terrestrivirus13_17 [Terrestrivirus sp.]
MADLNKKRWNDADINTCIEMLLDSKSLEEIGEKLKRTPLAIQFKRQKLIYELIINKAHSTEELSKKFGLSDEEVMKFFDNEVNLQKSKLNKPGKLIKSTTDKQAEIKIEANKKDESELSKSGSSELSKLNDPIGPKKIK